MNLDTCTTSRAPARPQLHCSAALSPEWQPREPQPIAVGSVRCSCGCQLSSGFVCRYMLLHGCCMLLHAPRGFALGATGTRRRERSLASCRYTNVDELVRIASTSCQCC